MRTLSKLFMVLSCPHSRSPSRRSRRAELERGQLGRDHRWILDGVHIARHLCPGTGQGDRRRSRRAGAQCCTRPGIQLALILGLALIESLALYTLVIILAKVKSRRGCKVAEFILKCKKPLRVRRLFAFRSDCRDPLKP